DRGQARVSRIAGETDLHRRRLAGKHPQSIPGCVHGQVHQDIDTVLANPLCYVLILPTGYAAPTVGTLAEVLGHPIDAGPIGIKEDLELVVVVIPKQRPNVAADDVIAKVRGNVTQPQAPAGRSVIGMGPDLFHERLGMSRTPAPQLVLNSSGAGPG